MLPLHTDNKKSKLRRINMAGRTAHPRSWIIFSSYGDSNKFQLTQDFLLLS
jgi:hypothetical protein